MEIPVSTTVGDTSCARLWDTYDVFPQGPLSGSCPAGPPFREFPALPTGGTAALLGCISFAAGTREDHPCRLSSLTALGGLLRGLTLCPFDRAIQFLLPGEFSKANERLAVALNLVFVVPSYDVAT